MTVEDKNKSCMKRGSLVFVKYLSAQMVHDPVVRAEANISLVNELLK